MLANIINELLGTLSATIYPDQKGRKYCATTLTYDYASPMKHFSSIKIQKIKKFMVETIATQHIIRANAIMNFALTSVRAISQEAHSQRNKQKQIFLLFC